MVGLAGHSLEPRHVGPPWSNQNDSKMAARGKSYGSDPAMAGQVHRLSRPGGPVLVTQIRPVCCLTLLQTGVSEAGATSCISLGRPLGGETTLPH